MAKVDTGVPDGSRRCRFLARRIFYFDGFGKMEDAVDDCSGGYGLVLCDGFCSRLLSLYGEFAGVEWKYFAVENRLDSFRHSCLSH